MKPKRKRSHRESEVDGQKTSRERKRKRTTSESSVDSEANEPLIDVRPSDGGKRKGKECKTTEQDGCERAGNGEKGWRDADGKDKKGKKFVRWQEE